MTKYIQTSMCSKSNEGKNKGERIAIDISIKQVSGLPMVNY
jgi:hypothetical protein